MAIIKAKQTIMDFKAKQTIMDSNFNRIVFLLELHIKNKGNL